MAEAKDSSQPDNATAVRTDSSDRRSARDRFTPGELLAGRFRIIAPLGRGGMGEVYRADDVKLGQPVALKFLPAALERDQDRLQRLYAEVRLGRQVSHPNVCRLYDIVEWEGSHFISMEYIDGEDLGSLIRRIGKLPQEKALELTHEICAGLVAAHGLGVIHRDLKPANIMIDGRGRARVTDFGLAAVEADLAGRHEVAGTPAYMAPEQMRGEAAVGSEVILFAPGRRNRAFCRSERAAAISVMNAVNRDRRDHRVTILMILSLSGTAASLPARSARGRAPEGPRPERRGSSGG